MYWFAADMHYFLALSLSFIFPISHTDKADPYGYAALEHRQQELERALHQRRQALASQLQVEEEMNCKYDQGLLPILYIFSTRCCIIEDFLDLNTASGAFVVGIV